MSVTIVLPSAFVAKVGKLDKVEALAERPGTPGEGAAARAAVDRIKNEIVIEVRRARINRSSTQPDAGDDVTDGWITNTYWLDVWSWAGRDLERLRRVARLRNYRGGWVGRRMREG